MWPADLNWQMTALFLSAFALLVLGMKVVALLIPATARIDRYFLFSPLLSPNSLSRARPVMNIPRVLFRTALLLGAVVLSYGIYWQLVRSFDLRGILLSYCAAPILLLVSELLAALVTVLWLPSGRLLPSLHERPTCPRGVGDFWANRWNLWFSDWFRYVVFKRIRRWPVLALILAFAVSGLMHEWAVNVPLFLLTGRAAFGSMMLYFLIQAAGILLERRFLKRHAGLLTLFAWLVVVAPVPLVINEGLLRTLHLWPEQVASDRVVASWVSTDVRNPGVPKLRGGPRVTFDTQNEGIFATQSQDYEESRLHLGRPPLIRMVQAVTPKLQHPLRGNRQP